MEKRESDRDSRRRARRVDRSIGEICREKVGREEEKTSLYAEGWAGEDCLQVE